MNDTGDVPFAQSLYAALVDLEDDVLLLPSTAIAEVLPYDRMQARPAAAGRLGTVDWRERQLAVLSFEALNGGTAPTPDRRSRLLVLHAIGPHLASRAWALPCTGYPRMIPLHPAALERVPPRPRDRAECILARVRVATRVAAIPDLDRIESELAASPAATA